MQIVVAEDRQQLGRYVAQRAAEIIRACLSRHDHVHLVVATGSSQFEVLSQLVTQPDIDWGRVHGFHLDEYLGIDQNHSASFCGYLKQRFVDHVPLGSFFYLDGSLPPEELRQRACNQLQGKRIDLLLCGIGENGHLAFNDPPADFQSEDPYLLVRLDEACRKQQVGEGWFDSLQSVPERAISMSVRQILKADTILCSAPDRRKAEAVQRSVEGNIDPMVPASILQQHPNAELILDTQSASLLSTNTLHEANQLASS
jgi:glucosamine-6-phosphate deaminase